MPMNSEKLKEYSGLLCRIITGGIFAISGITKALASAEMLIWQFSGLGLPDFACYALAYTLPYIEIAAGLFLITGLFMPFPALLLTAGLAIHEILLLQALLRGLYSASFPYFGPFMEHSISQEIFQNVLTILLLYPAVMSGKDLTLDKIIEKNLPRRI